MEMEQFRVRSDVEQLAKALGMSTHALVEAALTILVEPRDWLYLGRDWFEGSESPDYLRVHRAPDDLDDGARKLLRQRLGDTWWAVAQGLPLGWGLIQYLASRTKTAPAVVTDPAPKRSTERGEGRLKLIAALTKHHQYADGGCLNLEPIGNNELARLAGVDRATASAFFKQYFKGHSKYKALCRDAGKLTDALKLLNGEFAPHLLYGSKPADEDERDEE
jgi:hypothetical protein